MKKPDSFRTISLIAGVLVQLASICFHARGAAGDVDLSFDPGSGVNGGVPVLAVQPDGKVLISGSFTTIRGFARPGLARLNADGSGDSSFNPAVAGGGLIALQTDGRVLVNTYNGLVRLNADGSLDNTFTPTVAAIGIYAITVQLDGKILIGGAFTVVNGTSRFGIARLNANGTVDNSFNPGTGAYGVNVIVVQPDGRVLIAGDFQLVNGTSRSRVARLNANGSLDTSFDPGPGPSDWVATFALQPDGKVLIGGNFTAFNGTNRHSIARLNANGSVDHSFNPGTLLTDNWPTYSTVLAIAVQTDGKVLVGGTFSVNGTSLNNIARFNSDGTLDGGYIANTDAEGSVAAITIQQDGKVFLGGGFTLVNGTPRRGFARLNAGGSLDASFNPGSSIDSSVLTTALQPDGKLVIGGTFTTVGGLARTGLARLNPDGSVDSTFGSVINFLAIGSLIRSIALQPDGKVLATGAFAPTNGAPSRSIARFNVDGSWDSGFQPDLWTFVQPGDCVLNYGCSQFVEGTSFLVQPDGKVLVGGHVRTTIYAEDWSYDIYRAFLGRFETNGIRDWSFNSGTNYYGSCMARQPDGKILVGSVEGISRLHTNGTLDLSFNAGAIGSVLSIALQPDGKMILGGGFHAIQGTNHSGVLRLNANGSPDASFNHGPGASGPIYSVALQPNGKVLIGRDSSYDGTNFNTLSRRNADGSPDASFKPGSGTSGAVRVITVQPDGNFLIGGNFTTVNGAVRPYVARLYGDSAPSLNIVRSNGFAVLSLPVTGLNFHLQETTNLALPNSWSPVVLPIVTNVGRISTSLPMAEGRKFFRLKSQ